MTRDQFKQLIIKKVTDFNGCKATELAADKEVALACDFNLPEILEEIVNAGDLIEVEYSLLYIKRYKSFFLPRGSSVRIR